MERRPDTMSIPTIRAVLAVVASAVGFEVVCSIAERAQSCGFLWRSERAPRGSSTNDYTLLSEAGLWCFPLILDSARGIHCRLR